MNLFEAAELRDQKIAQVTLNAGGWVQEATLKAIEYARIHGSVTSDNLHEIFPLPPSVHRNATGAVFRDKRLKLVGFTQSTRLSSHARRIGIFSLREVAP